MKTKFTLLCFLFILYANINKVIGQVNVQDSMALVDLYNSTNGLNWKNHTNWLTSNPVSTWFGVTVTNSKVTGINLNNNDLFGSIPSSIGNLINLLSLSLEGDNDTHYLSGSIPSSLGNLVNLVDLDLSKNQLSSIPFSIGNLINLQDLNLKFNYALNTIPSSIGNLVNLQNLDLGVNQLSSIPSSISNLVNLQNLDISGNQLSSIPFSILKLFNLQSLDLQSNKLSSIPIAISNLVNLVNLNLSNNQLSGSIPSSLSNLVKLQQLDLEYNEFSGSIPASFGKLTNLIDLWLGVNRLSGAIPSSIGNLVNLSYLDLSSNQLSGTIPSSIGNMVNIGGLDLSFNQLSGAIPSSIGNLVNLSYLVLSDNTFTFDGMELIAQKFPFAYYEPQANIPVHRSGDALSISAGGTLSNNTYKWFSIEQNNSIQIVGDSVFHPSQSGHYYAAVTNAICTQLTLHTDTIFYDATLPVTIINLKAQQQKSVIKIDWTSVTEINVASYEIQRSSNALNFNTIGTLPARSNGTQKVNYTFNDVHPLHRDNYYRIKAVDKDGKVIYSNTVLVKMNDDKIITVVYPNPAKDILHVETNGNATFSLINQSGEILVTTNINGKGVISVSGITPGLYYLKNNSTGNVQKVVIAK